MNSILYKGVCLSLLTLMLWAFSFENGRSAPPQIPLQNNGGTTPTLTEVGFIPGMFAGSAVMGNYAYLKANAYDSVSLYDIRNPATPFYVGEVLSPPSYDWTTLVGYRGKLYLGSVDQIVEVDITNNEAPVIRRQFVMPFSTGRGVANIVAHGDYLYGSGETEYTRDNFFYLFAIHLPTGTVHIQELVEPTGTCQVAVSDGWLICNNNVFSLENPASPAFAYTSSLITSCVIYFDYPYLYTQDTPNNRTLVYQLENPASPQFLTSIPASFEVAALVPWGSQLLRIGTTEVLAGDWVDISNPAAPVANGVTLPLSMRDCSEPSQVSGPYLYLNNGKSFGIYQSDHSGYNTYLPQTGRDTCPPFIEDFSTTDNGWLEGGIFVQEFGYTNQEYYLRLLAPNFNGGVPVPLPCSGSNIHAEITGRWLTEPGAGFGIQFGPTLTSTSYYDFQVNPDSGTYYVLERTAAGTSVFVPETPTPALEAGQPALLEVSVVNGVTLLSVNGVALEEFTYLYEGPFQLRLSIASQPTQAELPLEARFDNMKVYLP